MMVRNAFRMNDWDIGGFLVAVMALQAALAGLGLLGAAGWQVPLLRPIIGFLYLTFIPGALLLRIFRVHRLSGTESLLYMAGLSLAFDMLIGFLINTLGPIAGIGQPLAEPCILVSMLIGVVVLSALCYFRDREFSDPGAYLEIDEKTLAPALFLLSVPLLSVVSSYLVNACDNDILVYVVILAIALVTALCGFRKFIPERLYPLAVLAVAAALLAQNAFLTNYLEYWDVHLEYYTASQVIASGHWDMSFDVIINAMLSIVILTPFYYNVCSLDLTWVFKVVCQLIFCLVPLGLYAVYRRQAGDRIACLACLFFVFLVTFFTEMQGLARQEVAELFLVLILLLVTDAALAKRVRSLWLIVFGLGLILSHYGLAYVYLLVFVMALALMVLAQRLRGRGHTALPADRPLTLPFVGLFVCFLFAWYLYTSQSTALSAFSHLAYKMMTNLSGEFLSPNHAQGLGDIVQAQSSDWYELKKYMYLGFQGLIVAGFLLVVVPWRRLARLKRRLSFTAEYVVFAFVNLLICVFAIVLPYFASSLNTSRLYHITLIVLSPLCIVGGLGLIDAAAAPLRRLRGKAWPELPLQAMTVVLIVYLFFSTGLVFSLMHDHPISLSLSKGQIDDYGLVDRGSLYDPLNTFGADYYAAGWLADHRAGGTLTYSDYIGHYPLTSYGNTPIDDERHLNANLTGIASDSYVYLGYPNLVGGVFKETSGATAVYDTSQVLPGLANESRIYDNSGSEIYYWT